MLRKLYHHAIPLEEAQGTDLTEHALLSYAPRDWEIIPNTLTYHYTAKHLILSAQFQQVGPLPEYFEADGR